MNCALITDEVEKLIRKQAIALVAPVAGQFLSHVFTVPKKDGSQRLVVNLRPLNHFVQKHHFKMEGAGMLRDLLQRNDWLVSIDLKDVYLSIQIAEKDRKFLRFLWKEQTYEFRCLPFGLSSAPRVFTKLLKPVMALLRRQGIRTIIFLDDLLVMGQSKEEMVSQVEEILHFFQLLGFVINQEKSVLSPSHTIQFLGFIVDSALMVISLPQKKVVDITKACQAALLQGTLSVRDLSRLIGQMSATMRAVLPAPLCYRNLQRIKNQELSRSHSFEAMVTLDDSAKEELLWWVHQLTTWNGRAILSQTPDLVVETDASLLGWGAVSEGVRTGGLWSEKERTQHINCLELMAGALAVRTFAKHKRNIHVGLRMDNKTAIFYINRMGGTRSQSMVQPACQLWQWCLQRGITLSAEYLPGAKNEIADKESRTMQSSAEWMLNAQVFKCIMQVMGPCQIDLFATRLNHQLDHYVSWRPDPFAMATDAFQITWRNYQGYAFPPFALVGKCLQKIHQEESTVVLVAPVWETQWWYPYLLQLLIDYPLLLPVHPDLLSDPFERKHPLMLRHQLQLAAWKVSGVSALQQGFQRGLQNSFVQDGFGAQIPLTNLVGKGGIAGVSRGKLIPFRVTSNHFWTF